MQARGQVAVPGRDRNDLGEIDLDPLAEPQVAPMHAPVAPKLPFGPAATLSVLPEAPARIGADERGGRRQIELVGFLLSEEHEGPRLEAPGGFGIDAVWKPRDVLCAPSPRGFGDPRRRSWAKETPTQTMQVRRRFERRCGQA